MRFLLSSSFCFLVVAALFLSPDLLHGQVTYTVTGFANLGFEGDPDSAPEVSLGEMYVCLLYTSPSPRDQRGSRMPSSA